MIAPTVGRKVWYRPSEQDIAGTSGNSAKKMEVATGQPLDATVTAVWGDRCVNLAIFDIYANVHDRRSVTLVQEGDVVPASGRYAEWMPYQTAQAKKEPTSGTVELS